MRIKKLRQKKVDLLAEAKTLTAKEDAGTITAEEIARLDAITKEGGEIDTVNAQIAREEKLMDERRNVEAVRGENDDTEEEATDRAPAAPRQESERFGSLGEMLTAVAASTNTRGEQRDRRLNWQQFQSASGQSEGSGVDGGFLVQQDHTDELLRLAYERSDLAGRTREIPLGPRSNGLRINAVKESSRKNGSRFGGIQAFWTGEGQQKTASQLKLRQMDLKLHKLTGLLYATDELLEDAGALEAVITEAFADEFSFKIDWAIFEGTGAGMPMGFMKSGALISVAKETSQAADTIVAENIGKMWSRMWSRSRRTAVWLINQSIEPQLMTLKIGNQPVYLPAGGLSQNPYSSLLGRPLIPTEFNEQLGDKGDIVFADLREYLMIRKGGLKKDVSIHVKFVEDETAFRFVLRLDGQPIWESPLIPFKGTETLSPFVTLDERS